MSFKRVASVTIQEEGQEGIEIKNLRIKFNVLKTEQKEPNTAEIQIYNSSRETYTRVAKTDNIATLRAGYEDEGGAKLTFSGNIVKSGFENIGTETRMILECADGQKDYRQIPISISYKKGTPINSVLSDILSSIPLTVVKQPIISGSSYESGYSFAGRAFDALEEVLLRVGLSYNIQNNGIYILDETETIETIAFLISPKTGLIGSPKDITDIQGETTKVLDKKKYEVRTLLNSAFLPGSFVQIESKAITGFYKSQTVEHNGDSWDGSFETSMEVIEK